METFTNFLLLNGMRFRNSGIDVCPPLKCETFYTHRIFVFLFALHQQITRQQLRWFTRLYFVNQLR